MFFIRCLIINLFVCSMVSSADKVIDISAILQAHLSNKKIALSLPIKQFAVFQVSPEPSGEKLDFFALCRAQEGAQVLAFSCPVKGDFVADEFTVKDAGLSDEGYSVIKGTYDRDQPFLEEVKGFKQAFPRWYRHLRVPGKTMPAITVCNNGQATVVTPLDYVPGTGATKFTVAMRRAIVTRSMFGQKRCRADENN